MPVNKDDDGSRYVEAEVEVPGSPEEVWRAIATADGISSWFVPTRTERDLDGRPIRLISSFGPGMDSVAEVKVWDPPRRFVAENEEGSGEHGPGTVATEWIVEARQGGTCLVRVVHRWFTDSDDWDGQFEGHAYGWASAFFRILKLYLTHFPGQECTAFDLAAFSPSPGPETWTLIASAFEPDHTTGRFEATKGAPTLSGTLESTEVTDPELLHARERAPQVVAALEGMDGEDPQLLLRLDRPASGLAHVFIMAMGDQTMVSMRFFFYGDGAPTAAATAERQWSGWLAERFPQPPSP
jgi:uncharacterized protein YndB with AHSA1/START domain